MDFFKELQKSDGGYIFLSHSHNDIDKVRRIRNGLEEDGFEPLCFYLKCLDDDSEIEDLIKREIDAREWFIFLDSENSRRSKWVTMEREYIKSTGRKKVISVDLDDAAAIRRLIERIKSDLRVYLSFSNRDFALARRVKNALCKKDYMVFFGPESIMAGDNFQETVTKALIRASEDGCVIALITEASVASPFMLRELVMALERDGNIIPIIVGDVELPPAMRLILSSYLSYRLPLAPTDEQIEEIIDAIGISIASRK